LRQVSPGDTIVQTLSGYPKIDTFTVLEILDESEREITVAALYFDDPPGVYVETIQKKFLEREYYRVSGLNGVREMRTQIL
jgi:uncharacterized OB-fold protein